MKYFRIIAPLVIILEIFAYINAYVVDLKAASIDSNRFQDEAAIWARGGEFRFVTDAEFFHQYLGILFRLFGESEFVATQFGLIALIAALYYILRMFERLGVRYGPIVVALVALWPSSLTRVTTTMREPYLIFFVVVVCYFLVKYRAENSMKYCYAALGWSLAGAAFHKGYAILFVGIIAYLFVMGSNTKSRGRDFRTKALKVGLIGFLVIALVQFKEAFEGVRGLRPLVSLMTLDSDYMSRIVQSKADRDFRTTYDAKINFDSASQFLTSAPITYLYYMFSPFPWMIRTGIDFFAFVEGCIRAVALGFLIIMFRKKQLNQIAPVIVVVLMLTFVWAAGTANYGTASRHHITTNWFFFMIYAYYFSIRKIEKQPTKRRAPHTRNRRERLGRT